jgi:hypothetical protein
MAEQDDAARVYEAMQLATSEARSCRSLAAYLAICAVLALAVGLAISSLNEHFHPRSEMPSIAYLCFIVGPGIGIAVPFQLMKASRCKVLARRYRILLYEAGLLESWEED